MTFLAGETLELAHADPTADDVATQESTGCYWWAALPWWIRCDLCGTVTAYHRPEPIESTEQLRAWELVWIAWEADGGGRHHCAPSCNVQLDLLGELVGAAA